MKELGKCATIVKRTMMDCFFVTDKMVRDSMLDERNPGAKALTETVVAGIGAETGKCYENGLNDMAKCLVKQEAEGGNLVKESESESESDDIPREMPREQEGDVVRETILDFDDLN